MNNRFKFRVWSVDDKQFVKSIYHAHTECYIFIHAMFGNPVIFSQYGEEVELDETKYIIQQFTGCHDSTNKEIYEGDILKNPYDVSDKIIGQVLYESDHGGYIFQWKRRGQDYKITNLNCDVAFESVIVGNIFETPQLLLC